MPIYEIEDPKTGMVIELEGPNPPSGDTIRKAFASVQGIKPEKPDTGFMSRISKRAEERLPYLQEAQKQVLTAGIEGNIPGAMYGLRRTAQEIAGGLGDIAGEGLASVYSTLPESFRARVESGLGNLAQTQPGQTALGGLGKVGQAQEMLKQASPKLSRYVGGELELLGAIPAGRGVQVGGREIAKQAIKRSMPSEKTINKVIDSGINAIRPSVAGKRTAGALKDANEKAREAVKSIIENKSALRFTDEVGEIEGALPETLGQFAESIEQTKKVIFNKYDTLALQAGESGVEINLAPIAEGLDTLILNESVFSPDIAKYAAEVKERLLSKGSLTISEAQEELVKLNKRLESFYKNPNPMIIDRAGVDHQMATNLRQVLDDTIETLNAPGYQDLKRQYGALKSIERDVVRRAVVDARKNVKGLTESLTDVAAGGTLIGGLFAWNPKIILGALGAKGMSKYINWLNSPNRRIKNMFKKTEKLISKSKEADNAT